LSERRPGDLLVRLRSPVLGAGKRTGTMDPLQHATEAAGLHGWEMSLRLAMLRAWPQVAATPGKQTSASRQCRSGSRRGSHPQVGWRRPGWLMSGGCARTCRALIETTGWVKSECGRDPRCASGLMSLRL
jgi:hypothetical protein